MGSSKGLAKARGNNVPVRLRDGLGSVPVPAALDEAITGPYGRRLADVLAALFHQKARKDVAAG